MWKSLKFSFQEWVVTYFFEKYFRHFNYPFSTIDYQISKLSADERIEYMQTVKSWYNSKAYRMEQTEMKKLFYKELSISTTNEIGRAAYRLCLLYMRKIEQRYKYLVDNYALEQHTENFNKK